MRQGSDLAKTFCRRLKDVLNPNMKVIFAKHPEEIFPRYILDFLKKKSLKISYLMYLKDQGCLQMSWRCLKGDDVQITYQKISRSCLIGAELKRSDQNMFFRCLRGDALWKYYTFLNHVLFILSTMLHWAYLISPRHPHFVYSIILINVVFSSNLVYSYNLL